MSQAHIKLIKCVRKRQVGLQNRPLCFVSRAGGVSYIRVKHTQAITHERINPCVQHIIWVS